MTERYLDTIPSNYCPECCSTVAGIIIEGSIQGCENHLNHEHLQEAYRSLKITHKGLQKKSLANQSRAKLGAERYLLEKKVEELESRCKYWKATAEEYEKALRSSVEAGKELIKAMGGTNG